MKHWIILGIWVLTNLSLRVTALAHEEVSDLLSHSKICHSTDSSSCCLLTLLILPIARPATFALPLLQISYSELIQPSILERPPR